MVFVCVIWSFDDMGLGEQVILSDKGSIANQSAISLIIRATGICWNQVVCKGMAGKQRLCLKIKKLSETQQSKYNE